MYNYGNINYYMIIIIIIIIINHVQIYNQSSGVSCIKRIAYS